MLRLTSLGVCNSFWNITEENNKFDIFICPDSKIGGVSYEKVRDENEKDLGTSDITTTNLQDDMKGPIIIEENREKVSKRMEDGGYMNISAGYHRSIFQDLESYLRTEVDLVEDGIRLILDKINSTFVGYELQPCTYTFRDLSESVFNTFQLENPASSNVIVIEFDDTTMKTKLVSKTRQYSHKV